MELFSFKKKHEQDSSELETADDETEAMEEHENEEGNMEEESSVEVAQEVIEKAVEKEGNRMTIAQKTLDLIKNNSEKWEQASQSTKTIIIFSAIVAAGFVSAEMAEAAQNPNVVADIQQKISMYADQISDKVTYLIEWARENPIRGVGVSIGAPTAAFGLITKAIKVRRDYKWNKQRKQNIHERRGRVANAPIGKVGLGDHDAPFDPGDSHLRR